MKKYYISKLVGGYLKHTQKILALNMYIRIEEKLKAQ